MPVPVTMIDAQRRGGLAPADRTGPALSRRQHVVIFPGHAVGLEQLGPAIWLAFPFAIRRGPPEPATLVDLLLVNLIAGAIPGQAGTAIFGIFRVSLPARFIPRRH